MDVLRAQTLASRFKSILFGDLDFLPTDDVAEPACFLDLNLDQAMASIVVGREEYNLKPFFHTKLTDTDLIQFRHEIVSDLSDDGLRARIDVFAEQMRRMRKNLKQCNKLRYQYHKEAVFLDTIEEYVAATAGLAHDIRKMSLRSRGLIAFRDYITDYVCGADFTAMQSELQAVRRDLAAIRYSILIYDAGFTVKPYRGEPDYSEKVMEVFARFRRHAAKNYLVGFKEYPEMNHIEEKVLEFIAELNPQAFARLEDFCKRYQFFEDDVVIRFDREIQFYLAYLDYIQKLRSAGLSFCLPTVSAHDKQICVRNGFDLVLAAKLLGEEAPIVCNDFYLEDRQRIFVVSGPNQGGKTTFARMFGQLHYLAVLGLPVPGEEARLYLFDNLFTHFERREDIKSLRGKLQDDLVRIRDILAQATSNSIIVMNEIFTSTTLQDAQFLSRRIIKKILALDALCVCVTFLSELSTLNEQTVSMISTVVPDNPAQRTYKVLRLPAEGKSYAMAIAEKYGVTYRALMERIA